MPNEWWRDPARQERLRVVEQNISHFKFLRAALQTRFPDTKI